MISSITTADCICSAHDDSETHEDEEDEEFNLFGIVEETMMAQNRRQGAREKQRHYHDKKTEKRTPWIPITGVLVDCIQKTDQTSTHNRKMAMKLQGPYRVKNENNPFTLLLEKIDETTFDVVGEPFKTHIKYVRPSVIARSLAISHGLIPPTSHEQQPIEKTPAKAKVYQIPQRRSTTSKTKRMVENPFYQTRGRHPYCPTQ